MKKILEEFRNSLKMFLFYKMFFQQLAWNLEYISSQTENQNESIKRTYKYTLNFSKILPHLETKKNIIQKSA